MSLITMSDRELDRLRLVQRVEERRITQVAAAEFLGLSRRQMARLVQRYRLHGANGLVSRRRNRPSNNRYPDSLRRRVLALIRERYSDFGPTLAAEKLWELHAIQISVSTCRQWMIDGDIWKPRDQRLQRAYQPRYRRSSYGELIQIDGSDHHWFERRGPRCVLLVYIDDATGQLQELRFVPTESAFAYFEATKDYLRRHGKPVAFYSDKAGIFRTNKSGDLNGNGITQFGRALHDLNIDIICANSPQAKGRVERANLTLQDRLVKELRLRGIDTLEDGNAYLPGFVADFNKRFGKAPQSDFDAHRPLRSHEDLEQIFTWQQPRTLSRSLTLQYDKVLYLIEDSRRNRKLARQTVIVHEHPDGRIWITHENRELPYSIFDKLRRVDQGVITDNKRLGQVLAFVKEEQSKRSDKRSQSGPSKRHRGQVHPRTRRRSSVPSQTIRK